MSATAINAPSRSLAQRMEALKRANHIRSRRAELKRDLKARRTLVCEILARPPEYVFTMHVQNLLMAAPKYGKVKVKKALERAKISPSKTVGGISPRQREALLCVLESREDFGGWR